MTSFIHTVALARWTSLLKVQETVLNGFYGGPVECCEKKTVETAPDFGIVAISPG
jgi:hypothetical protein